MTDQHLLEISKPIQAEKTDKPADKDVQSAETNDQGLTIKEACSGSGWIRRITYNGTCYVQMCCGGQWFFWHRGNVWCTCNLGESWTVNCNGNNYIIPCR
jgi:hypothetical protein